MLPNRSPGGRTGRSKGGYDSDAPNDVANGSSELRLYDSIETHTLRPALTVVTSWPSISSFEPAPTRQRIPAANRLLAVATDAVAMAPVVQSSDGVARQRAPWIGRTSREARE